MRLRKGETPIIIPAGIGMNPSVDPEVLNPQAKVALLTNLDTRKRGQWTKRLPIVKQNLTGLTVANDPISMWGYLKKADAENYDIIIRDSGKLYVRHHVTTGTPPDIEVLYSDAAWVTANSTPRYVFYRDKIFIFTGEDTLKFFLDGSGTYVSGTNYGDAGVDVPDYKPFTDGYSLDKMGYGTFDESDGGILGGLGNGIIQYRQVYEYEEGALYGNPGGTGYHYHEMSKFHGGNGYGNPVVVFQWFNRYQLERIIGRYDAEGADNPLVTARVLAYRHKHYADEPFTSWERSPSRNVNALNAGTDDDKWTDASIRTGIPLEINNDAPTKFKYAAVVGGREGVMVNVNRQDQRPIPVPKVTKTAMWGTPTYRNQLTIVNNGANTHTRPTIRIPVNAADLEDDWTPPRDIITTYDDFVFTDLDGLSIWDCYECPFEPYPTFGDSLTELDIVDTGTTATYAYNGVGGAPLFVTNGAVAGEYMKVNGQNFNALNNGFYEITSASETVLVLENASAFNESATIGTGYIARNVRNFVVSPPELIGGQEIRGYLYYRDVTGDEAAFYGHVNNVIHPPFVDTKDIFLSWSNERNWKFLSDSTSDNEAIRNRADLFDGNFLASPNDPSWDNTIDSRPYGLDSTNDISSAYLPLYGVSDAIGLRVSETEAARDDQLGTLSVGDDPIGRQLNTATYEMWFRVSDTLANHAIYALGGYRPATSGGTGLAISLILDLGAALNTPAVGCWLRFEFQAEGANNTNRYLKIGDTAIVENTWVKLGLSFDEGGTFNAVCVVVSSAAPATNWSDTLFYDTVTSGNVSNNSYTVPAYSLGVGDGYWYMGANRLAQQAVNTIAMYTGDFRLSEQYLSRAELADRARDWTHHGNTDVTNSTSQPDLSVSISTTSEGLSDTEVDETEVNWSKVNGEVFPLEQTLYLPEAGTGVTEWQADAVAYTENGIHRIVTSKRPEEWEILENVAQEASGVGNIADKSLIKTESHMVFMSQFGLYGFDGRRTPINLSEDMWQYWLETYGLSALKDTVCFYWAREGQIFVSIPTTASGDIDNTYVLDWGLFSITGKTEWHKYEHDTATSFGARLWVLKDASVDEQDAYFASGFSDDAVLYKIGLHNTLGDRSTTLTVTRPGTPNANTTRYTYTTVGTDPHFEDELDVGDSIVVNCPTFADTDNNGTFTITAVGANYFEITDTATGAEADVTLDRDDGLICKTNNALYQDLDEDNNNVAIDWDVDTAEIVTDNADLTQIDIRMEQKQTSGTDRSSPIVTTVINRDGSTNQTLTDRTLSKVETLKPRTHVADSIQLKLDPDSTNDPTDQTRIKRVEVAIKPEDR